MPSHRLESDELRFMWTISQNKDGLFFLFSAKQVKVHAKWDPRDPAKTSGQC